MEVILLERVAKLGAMGETVRVRDGFARNFLLPQGKALRATASAADLAEGISDARMSDSVSPRPEGSLSKRPRDAAAIPCNSPRNVMRFR